MGCDTPLDSKQSLFCLKIQSAGTTANDARAVRGSATRFCWFAFYLANFRAKERLLDFLQQTIYNTKRMGW